MSLVMNASGRMINPFNLQPVDFDPRVMAQTLSRICRFWGQTSEFYSVAQHCLVMESLFDDADLKRWAMIHEVFESLTGMDIPTPIKYREGMIDYREAESRCLDQAAELFGLTPPMPDIIKVTDKRLLVTEALRFMNAVNYDWKQIAEPYSLSVIGKPMDIEASRVAYLTRWYALFG